MARGISIHVGLNRVDPRHYQGWSGDLAACEFDAQDVEVIAKEQGFTSKLFLTEQATAQNIIGAIAQATDELRRGDLFWLTYSGHGGQVPDINGLEDEDDELDETWCLYDRQLIDDELYALWGKFETGVRICMLSDSCHSGTISKDPEKAQVLPSGIRFRELPITVRESTYAANRALYEGIQQANPHGDRVAIGATVLLLSGCRDNQTSLDGDRNGLFTATLLKVWNGGRYKGSLRRFYRLILEKMPLWQSPNYFMVGPENRNFERRRPFTI